jgi:micrococcal nuclease
MDSINWEQLNEETVPKFSLEGQQVLAKVTSVYDGDTVKLCFGFSGNMYIWNCRIEGVDTPELRTRNLKEKEYGYKVRDELRKLILGKVFKVQCGEFDKYGRLLVNILLDDELTVSKWLIDNEYAFYYDGGTKRDWEKFLNHLN